MWNSHSDTQHPVGAVRGTGDSAPRLTEGQHWDQGPAGDETHRGHSHTMGFGLNSMGNGDRESTPGRGCHFLEGGKGVGG